MGQAFTDNSLSIGRTPLVKLNRIVPNGAEVYAKIEGRNPAYSVKCRIGAAMIWDADVLISGVGTGGTISGIAQYFEQDKGKPLHSVAVEPSDSPVISQHLAGQAIQPGPHRIQGIV